uniref:MHC class I antigen n=1 Tax=Ctenopharyngodon idella TaxID=7959 RepID=A0A6B9M4E3_CTEID|nr:MHC class I antigen [Ctenopharyngodon idella]
MRAVVLLLLGVNLVSAATHTLQYFYTATTGITNFPRFVDVGMLNGEQISMYDSTSQRKIPKQKWMAENLDQEYWDSGIKVLKGSEQLFFNNIQVAMSRFNQSAGVHTWQLMYGCELNEDGTTRGYRQYGYDGGDFVSFDKSTLTYTAANPEAVITKHKWEADRASAEQWKGYLENTCIEWLKKYVGYGKDTLERKVSPQVSLLQKDPSSPVTCHATGFYPSGVTITWQKNGQDHDEDVDLGELLPNEDGSFQRMSTLNVGPDEWKKNRFSCVVEHQDKTIRKTEKKIRAKNETSVPIGIIGAVAAVILLVVIGVAGFMVYRKKKGFKPVEASDNSSNERITDTLISSGSGSSTSS